MNDRHHLRVVPDARPDLRRTPRLEAVVYRVRVALDGSDPLIWRQLDLRSDITLDLLHQALQVAFDWTDSHLHRFSLGGRAFDRHSQLFLCPSDVDNDDGWENVAGVPAAETRLDETLAEPGDVLHYLYDYGDNWELTLRVEQVLPAESGCGAAVVVDGERAAPPEDCGHLVDAAALAEVLPDPARFEPERLNRALGGPYFVLREAGVDRRLVDVVHQLTFRGHGDELTAAALRLADPTPWDAVDVSAHLRAFQWFLDRAVDGGIPLTGAGYLKPPDVEEAAKAVPTMADWLDFGKNNRETHCYPVLHFRRCLQDVGLLRKNKTRLLLTKAGEAAQRDVDTLWQHLAGRLVPKAGDTFGVQATLLILFYAAASADADLPFDEVAALLAELGWRHSDGRPVEGSALRHLPAWTILTNVSDRPVPWQRHNIVSPAAAALARDALRDAP